MNTKSTQEIQALHLANAVHFQAFLLENISDAVITTDMERTIVSWNRAAETIYGWSAEAAIGQHILGFLQTELRGFTSDSITEEVAKHGKWQGDVIQHRKDGYSVNIAMSVCVLLDAQGQSIGTMLINKDITEVRQNEQAIQESEERFRTLVENMPAGLIIYDTNAKVIFANKRASSLLGVSHDVIMAYSLRENNTSYVRGDGSPLSLAEHPINLIFASGQAVEEFEIGIKGPHLSERVWLQENLYPLMNEQQQVQQVVMTFTDITQRKQAEIKLQEAHNTLEEKVRERTIQLENARDLLESRNLALTILHQGVLEIAAKLDIPMLLHHIMLRAVELLNAFWGGGIYLYDAETEDIRIAAVSGINEGRAGIHIPRDAGVAGRVLQSGKPLIVNNYLKWEGRINVLMTETASAVMGVPLLVQGRAVGALLVFANSQERQFNDEDVVIAEMFAAQAANALHNVQLYSAAQWELEERKKTEAALRESEERFRQIAENFDQILFLRSSDDTKMLYINPRFETIWGRSRESVYENPERFMEDIHPDDRNELEQLMKTERFLKEGLSDSEYRLMTPDRGIRWMRVRRFPIKNEEGVILHRAGIAEDVTERKLAEETLAEERNLLRTVIDALPDLIYVKDLQHRFVVLNKAASIPSIDLIGKTDFHIRPGPLAEEYYAFEEKIFRTGQALIDYEDYGALEDQWFLTTKVPLRNVNGQLIGLVGIGRDITERKQTELMLAKRNLALTSLHAGVLDITGELDMSALLPQIMRRAIDLLHADRGGGIYLYNHEENDLRLVAVAGINAGRQGISIRPDEGVAGRVLQTGEPLIINDYASWDDHAIILVSGPSSAVMGVPLLIRGQVVGALLVFANSAERTFTHDDQHIAEMFAAQAAAALHNAELYSAAQREIVSRQQTEAALRESEERFRQIAENFDQILFLRSSDENKILYINPSYETLWGKSRESLYENADDFMEDIHPDDRKALEESMRSERYLKEGLADNDYRLLVPEKGARWMRVRRFPIKNEEGVIVHRAGIVEDITERKLAEEALKQALATEKELGELKTRFVSMASHEFRTPLATIYALTDTLSAYRQRLSEQQIDNHFEKIKTQVNRLKVIIDEVLFLARVQAHRLEFNPVILDLDELCRSVLDEYQSLPDFKQKLVYSCDENVHELLLDGKLMRQVITNLLSNAMKYSPAKSLIQMKLSFVDEVCILNVQDQGIGIPEADLKHLFNPFHRAANVGIISGTGLGLVIIKESVELHGGTIHVETRLGSGTNFIIRIPISPQGGNKNDKNSGN